MSLPSKHQHQLFCTTCNCKVWRKKPACPGPNFVPIFATILSDGDFTSNTGWATCPNETFLYLREQHVPSQKLSPSARKTMISKFWNLLFHCYPYFLELPRTIFCRKLFLMTFLPPGLPIWPNCRWVRCSSSTAHARPKSWFYGRFLEFGGRTSGIPIPSIHYLYSIERSVFNCLKTRFQPPRNFPHLFKQILPNLNLPYVFLGARGGGSPTNQDTSWVRRTSSNICSDSATSAPSPVGKPTKRQAEEWEMFVWLLRNMCLFFFLGGGVGGDAKLGLIFGGGGLSEGVVYSRKTFRRRVLQKIVGVSHTTHISHHTYPTHIHHTTHIPHISIQNVSHQYVSVQHVSHQYVSMQCVSIQNVCISRFCNTNPTNTYPLNMYPTNTYPCYAYPFNAYPFKRCASAGIANVSHQYISHQYVSSTRIPPVRIHSMRIHS